jgi:hypothetical protein
MKRKALAWTVGSAALVLGLWGLTGCGRNEAQGSAAATGAGDQPAAVADNLAEPLPGETPATDERPAAPDERETDLAEREQAVADREEQLTAREQEIDSRIRELDARQAEHAEPPAPEPSFEPIEPEPEPEPVARTVVLTVPAATPIEVEFEDALSSEASFEGDRFRAAVTRDVFAEGHVAIPAGSRLRGIVASVDSQKRIGGQARLSLSFDRLELPWGETMPVQATLDLEGEPQKKKDAATIGGAAAGGAVLGRVLSHKKGKGTAIGAILGAAVGAAVASENAGDPVVIDPGMLAELRLESPLEVAVVVSEQPAVAGNR